MPLTMLYSVYFVFNLKLLQFLFITILKKIIIINRKKYKFYFINYNNTILKVYIFLKSYILLKIL